MERRCDRNGPSDSCMWARHPGLQAALLQLSDPVREFLFLSGGAGLFDKRLADVLDSSTEATRHRVSRGRSVLMGLLGNRKISTANCSA
jgi:DNA-directed RNA polymerase specialized sigma24 family protein